MDKETFIPEEPIVIIGLPRSGTSMVAGLFAMHGVFTGVCKPADKRNPKGFYEHTEFTNMMVARFGKGKIMRCKEAEPYDEFREELLSHMVNEGYSGGAWLVKHAHVYHKMWRDFRPRFVVVRRPTAGIEKSIKAVGWRTSQSNIIKGQRLLNKITKRYKACVINSQSIIDNDFKELHNVFIHCGLELDEDIVKKFVDKKLWGNCDV